MGDRLTSWIRTTVPMIWGAVVGWLLLHGWVDTDLADTMRGWADAIATGTGVLLGAVWHAVVRAVEHRLPPWLVLILLGSARQPSYEGGINLRW